MQAGAHFLLATTVTVSLALGLRASGPQTSVSGNPAHPSHSRGSAQEVRPPSFNKDAPPPPTLFCKSSSSERQMGTEGRAASRWPTGADTSATTHLIAGQAGHNTHATHAPIISALKSPALYASGLHCAQPFVRQRAGDLGNQLINGNATPEASPDAQKQHAHRRMQEPMSFYRLKTRLRIRVNHSHPVPYRLRI